MSYGQRKLMSGNGDFGGGQHPGIMVRCGRGSRWLVKVEWTCVLAAEIFEAFAFQDPPSCAKGSGKGLRLVLDMGGWKERRWLIGWDIYKG